MRKLVRLLVVIGALALVPAAFAVASSIKDEVTKVPEGQAFAIDRNVEPIICPDGAPLVVSDEVLQAMQTQREGGMGDRMTGDAVPRCADGSTPGGPENVAGVREVVDDDE